MRHASGERYITTAHHRLDYRIFSQRVRAILFGEVGSTYGRIGSDLFWLSANYVRRTIVVLSEEIQIIVLLDKIIVDAIYIYATILRNVTRG